MWTHPWAEEQGISSSLNNRRNCLRTLSTNTPRNTSAANSVRPRIPGRGHPAASDAANVAAPRHQNTNASSGLNFSGATQPTTGESLPQSEQSLRNCNKARLQRNNIQLIQPKAPHSRVSPAHRRGASLLIVQNLHIVPVFSRASHNWNFRERL